MSRSRLGLGTAFEEPQIWGIEILLAEALRGQKNQEPQTLKKMLSRPTKLIARDALALVKKYAALREQRVNDKHIIAHVPAKKAGTVEIHFFQIQTSGKGVGISHRSLQKEYQKRGLVAAYEDDLEYLAENFFLFVCKYPCATHTRKRYNRRWGDSSFSSRGSCVNCGFKRMEMSQWWFAGVRKNL